MSRFRGAVVAVLAFASVPHLAAAPAATEVRITEHRYGPATVTVERGATVRWVNDDDDPHTVTSDQDAFASPGMDKRDGWSFTFASPGTYPYHCALHPTMTGTVVVR